MKKAQRSTAKFATEMRKMTTDHKEARSRLPGGGSVAVQEKPPLISAHYRREIRQRIRREIDNKIVQLKAGFERQVRDAIEHEELMANIRAMMREAGCTTPTCFSYPVRREEDRVVGGRGSPRSQHLASHSSNAEVGRW